MCSLRLACIGVGASAIVASSAAADRFILNWGGENNLVDEIVFVHPDNSVTREPINPSTNTFTEVPPQTRAYIHQVSCASACVDFKTQRVRTLAVFEDMASGQTLQGIYSDEADPDVSIGAQIQFVSGVSPAMGGLELRDPGIAFAQISDAQFVDNSVFPFFSGTAEVIGLIDVDVRAPCDCEIDGDYSSVTIFDLLAYLQLWFAQDAAAELDGQVGISVFDLLAFLDCWFPASTAGGFCEAP